MILKSRWIHQAKSSYSSGHYLFDICIEFLRYVQSLAAAVSGKIRSHPVVEDAYVVNTDCYGERGAQVIGGVGCAREFSSSSLTKDASSPSDLPIGRPRSTAGMSSF
jgi:hypothetical protein